MPENKRAIATDLKALDAHAIKPEEYEDAPELTDEQLTKADMKGGKLVRRGRPPSPGRKTPVKLRLDRDLVERLRASGPGWQTWINRTLRKAGFKRTAAGAFTLHATTKRAKSASITRWKKGRRQPKAKRA